MSYALLYVADAARWQVIRRDIEDYWTVHGPAFVHQDDAKAFLRGLES
jgi:hypothetical protein